MLDAQGIGLLRALIGKMWALNEARDNGDCAGIAYALNSWLPPVAACIEAADVAKALGRMNGHPVVNIALLRAEIDKMPTLYSARLNGDYQAILNEVRLLPGLNDVALADVVEAMAHNPISKPENAVAGTVRLTGISRLG